MKRKNKSRLTRRRKKQKENLIYRSFLKDWKDDIHSDDKMFLSVISEEDFDRLRFQGLENIYLNAIRRAMRYFRRFGKIFAVVPESVEFAKRIGYSEETTPNMMRCIREFEEMNKHMPGKPASLLE